MINRSRFIKSTVINEEIQCNKCIIVASALFKQLVNASQNEQKLIYRISEGSQPINNIIYTNAFNIVIDLVFRMTYRINKLFNTLKTVHGVNNIILFNDLTAQLVSKTDDYYKQQARKQYIHDYKTLQSFSRDFSVKLIIQAFKKWCLFYDVDEEEDYEPIEESLAVNYPEYYDFVMKEYRVKHIINPLAYQNYKTEKRKALLNLIDRIISVQTVLTPKMIDKCCELVLLNLERNKQFKVLKVFTTNTPNIEERFIFSLFPNECVIYITNSTINSRYAFFIKDFQLYYPYIKSKKTKLTLVNEDPVKIIQLIISDNQEMNAAINKYNKSKKSSRVNTFMKLLTTCQNESVCGAVLDINGNYRYTVFENIKSLIVDKLIETEFPPYIKDKELIWISVDDYIEQLPAWIAQFNSISRIKIIY